MRRNFDMDAAIRRAIRESIEAHAHEWEPDFKTGVGPVGDDAPFDKKVSGEMNECGDKEGCCPKCGKCPCECKKEEGDMNEGTIPGDSREWEPDFKTGVGEVGDDSPFTQAVNEALTDTRDWEDGSFGAKEPKKQGIAYADGADECGNGVVATGQKNSGEVVSQDSLNESEDEEGEDEGIGGGLAALGKAAWNGVKKAGKAIANTYNRGSKAQDIRRDRRERDAGQAKVDAYNEKYGVSQPSTQQAQQGQQAPQTAKQAQQGPQAQQGQQGGGMSDSISKSDLQQWMRNHAGETDKNGAWENLWQFVTGKAELQESKEEEKDVIAEERDRFFNIINRIEKLYD